MLILSKALCQCVTQIYPILKLSSICRRGLTFFVDNSACADGVPRSPSAHTPCLRAMGSARTLLNPITYYLQYCQPYFFGPHCSVLFVACSLWYLLFGLVQIQSFGPKQNTRYTFNHHQTTHPSPPTTNCFTSSRIHMELEVNT